MFCTGWEARSAWFQGGPTGMVEDKCFGILVEREGEGLIGGVHLMILGCPWDD
jgi:hypothetical protein